MIFAALLATIVMPGVALAIGDNIQYWSQEFPRADFTKRAVDISEIRSDGATRDTIRPIIKPIFKPVKDVSGMGEIEPVVSVEIDFDARAYPLRLLVWHELVNDELANVPILVSYSPLTNSAQVYDRRADGKTTPFGNTGRTRHFDTIMYDAATESWWQRYSGSAILGTSVGKELKPLVSRVESLARFRARHPDADIMVPADPPERPYGSTPYVRMDTKPGHGLEAYPLPKEIKPFDRVVVVGGEAWPFKRLQEKGAIERGNLYIAWEPGQNSAHDTKWIHFGRDVGNVVVRRYDSDNEEWADELHTVAFAFAFKAFHPEGVFHPW